MKSIQLEKKKNVHMSFERSMATRNLPVGCHRVCELRVKDRRVRKEIVCSSVQLMVDNRMRPYSLRKHVRCILLDILV